MRYYKELNESFEESSFSEIYSESSEYLYCKPKKKPLDIKDLFNVDRFYDSSIKKQNYNNEII